MRRTSLARVGSSALILACSALLSPAQADSGVTSTQAKEILEELRAIHKLLERQNAPANAPAPAPAPPQAFDKVSLNLPPELNSQGPDKASLVMVEFSDYQCPFCRRYFTTTFEQLREKYVVSGKLKYVVRDFPLDFHANAGRAALAARCAGEQGKFWELRRTMIVNADKLEAENLNQYAKDLSLSVDALNRCIDEAKYKPAMELDLKDGKSAGISGTPSFVIGRVKDGVLSGIKIVGAQPASVFEAQIDALLKQ